MAHNPVQMEICPSPALGRHPLPPLHTSSSDLTQSTFADASDAAPDSTAGTPSTATSIYSASESASQPPSQPQPQPQPQQSLQSQSFPKMPAATLAEPAMIPTANSGQLSDSVARRDDATSSIPVTAMATKTPPHSPAATTRSRSMTLDTPIQFRHGQKRTAAGEMKASVSPAQLSTPRNYLAGITGRHSRTTSTDSNAGRIAEVSAQLRAKLSYAAARVESQRQLRSPEPKNKFSPSSPARNSTRPRQSLSFSHPEPRSAQFKPDINNSLARISPAAETRNISVMPNGQNAGMPGKLDMSQIPKLAPPADIVARNGGQPRRRPNPNLANRGSDTFKSPDRPSFLSQQSSNSSSQNNSLVRETPPPHSQPSYPQRTPAAGQRTPSQNALMEQDAIETLLFMSSPENSGYRANTQQSTQPSNLNVVSSAGTMAPPINHNNPVREPEAQGIRNDRDANYAHNGPGGHLPHNASHSHYLHNGSNSRRGASRSRDEIDRMLDEMPDSDSDMEDGWFERLAAQYPPEQYPTDTQPVHDGNNNIVDPGAQQNRLWTSFP